MVVQHYHDDLVDYLKIVLTLTLERSDYSHYNDGSQCKIDIEGHLEDWYMPELDQIESHSHLSN